MRGQVLLAFALVFFPGDASAQPAEAVSTAGEWAREVARHQPGTIDEAARTIAGWSAEKFELVRRGLRQYILVQRWDDPERENEVFQRGALLHTDIAILAPAQASTFLGAPSWYTAVTRGMDGERRGDEVVTGHWAFARMLLDEVKPQPAGDETVRRWYVAVASYMELNALLGIASAHLARAQQVLPGDPDILFLAGAMHETFASARYQAVARGAANRFERPGIDSAGTELRRAERYFRQALARRPDFIEARIRLGHVLGALDRHDDAAVELRSVLLALAPHGETLLRYYCQMFLGRAEAALGRRDAAREAFQAAASIYPTAQSPLLALSELARRHGDRRGALAAIRALAALDPEEDGRTEPWWVYTLAQGRSTDRLFGELRAPFLHPTPP